MESGYAQPWFYGMSQAVSISRNHPYTTQQPQEMIVHYPFHPLAGQTVTAYWTQSLQGVEHYHVLTPEMREMLVPTWMCHPETFDAAIVSDPVMDLAALKQLHILVQTALSSLQNAPHTREEQDAEGTTTAPPLSRGRDLTGPPAQRGVGQRR